MLVALVAVAIYFFSRLVGCIRLCVLEPVYCRHDRVRVEYKAEPHLVYDDLVRLLIDGTRKLLQERFLHIRESVKLCDREQILMG